MDRGAYKVQEMRSIQFGIALLLYCLKAILTWTLIHAHFFDIKISSYCLLYIPDSDDCIDFLSEPHLF